MNTRTEYLEIHEKAYKRLLSDGKSSWSSPEDLEERLSFYRNTLDKHKVSQGSSVLILGCGDGETSLSLAALGYNVTGIDISPTAIRWAIEKAKRSGTRCHFTTENIALGFSRPEPFDAIIDDHCLHCIIGHDRSLALGHVYSALRAGGLFIMRTQCGDPPADISQEFMKMWDPDSRCQVHNGVAGRYFGLPESILKEIRDASLHISQNRVFSYPNGWSMLEAVAHRRE